MLTTARNVARWLGATTFFAAPPFVNRLAWRWISRHVVEAERACRRAPR
jgi:hypothetical protein